MIRVAPVLAIGTLLPFALAAQPSPRPTPGSTPPPAPTATSGARAAPTFDTETWKQPIPPVHIAGPIHYVGTADLGVYLITTPAGHILLDGALAESAPHIEQSIRTLGFKPEDVKILLISQAHFDHVASLAHIKRLTGAQLAVMKGDDTLLESGGRSDYLFSSVPAAHFEPVKADRVLQDGDTISLGGITLTARLTPGHTPGTTTWLTTVQDGGRPYRVVFAGSASVNPGTRLVRQPSYPGILEDFRRTFRVLESLEHDIFLAAHASFFNLAAKREKAIQLGAGAYVDPDGYRRLIAAKKAAFEELVAAEASASGI